ncbi:pantothenate transporter Fen2p [[Candida] railenensis]|uniref:Pantothenate transporter Fen2p n=1 Tax=[Candida] railenensis TaxID=45579 RepID=A0A9P0VY26_9ASCO|nr:pantothenate transporter Fen2p [[Candida] railenensis]
MTVLRSIRTFIWGEKPSNPQEAKLLKKIDWFVLSFACLLYWINYVDRLNVANAYVSGMKEDLNMAGNDYNKINTVFTVGYTVFLIPHNLVLLKVRPKYWLSFCGFAWGLLTLGIYKVTDYKQILVIRFFQAGFEASTFVGVHLILGSWYKEEELTKRSAIFTSAGLIGNIFSSTMQAAIYTNMDDLNGLAGWRWLFIIDFIITMPIILYGFIFFPDTPETCNAFYFNQDEIELAKARVPQREITKFDWSIFKRVVGKWHWWLFSFLWVLGGENESYGTNTVFALWLEYFGYSVTERNHYPMGVYAVGIVATICSALYVDNTGAKYHWRIALLIMTSMLISTIIFLARPLDDSFLFASQFLSGISYAGQATFFAWANVVCQHDLEERAVVLASMNMFSNAVNAWWSILFYAADTAPKFRKGCYAMLATSIASGLVACAMRYLQIKDQSKEQKEMGELVDVEALSVSSQELSPTKEVAVATEESVKSD